MDPCGDGSLNGDETDVDCGGSSCPKCALGGTCQADSDCGEGLCAKTPPSECLGGSLRACVAHCSVDAVDQLACTQSCSEVCEMTTQTCAFSCTDGVANGDETDVDCGGSCPSCESGGSCLQNSDCADELCVEAPQAGCVGGSLDNCLLACSTSGSYSLCVSGCVNACSSTAKRCVILLATPSPTESQSRTPTVVRGSLAIVGITFEEWNSYEEELKAEAKVSIANAAEVRFDQVTILKAEAENAPQRRRVLQETSVAVDYEVSQLPTLLRSLVRRRQLNLL